MIESLIILFIVLHWSFALGQFIAYKSDIPISRFLLLILFMKMMTVNLTQGGV